MPVTLASEKMECLEFAPEEWPQVAPVWDELFRSSTRFGFFLSEPWVESWIAIFGPALRVRIAVFARGGQPLGACLLVEPAQTGAARLYRRLFLNTSGEDAREAAYPEYNDLLCRPGAERAVAAALAARLRAARWDELRLEGFQPGPGYDALRRELAGLRWEEDWRESFYADLTAIRRSGGDYESVLGKTTRKHLRQSRRRFARQERLVVETPESLPAALACFEEMAALNRARRQARWPGSVFASRRFVEFHRRLITRCFPERSLLLLRVRGGSHLLGIVYLFAHQGHVSFYQSGIDYGLDPRSSPGTLTVAESVRYCLASGYDEFDFLAGDAEYKRRLATGSRPLVWAAAGNPGGKGALFRALRKLRNVGRRVWGGES